MDIIFNNKRIKKDCNNATGKLRTRLDDLAAANNLWAMKYLPGRTHPLRENRSGQWAIDLIHPKRLIFESVDIIANGWDSAKNVTAIKIIEIVDYHG